MQSSATTREVQVPRCVFRALSRCPSCSVPGCGAFTCGDAEKTLEATLPLRPAKHL